MPDIEQSIQIAQDFCRKWERLGSPVPGVAKYFSNTDSLPLDTIVYAYPDSGGVPTIGWGTTKYHFGAKAGQDVQLGDSITKLQADQEFDYETRNKEQIIRTYFLRFDSMLNNQYAAFISFAYNAGQGSLQKSNILSLYNAGADAATVTDAWKKQNLKDRSGKTVNGLINRRKDEAKLYDGSYNELYSYYLRNQEEIIKYSLIFLAVGGLLSISLYLKLVVFKKSK